MSSLVCSAIPFLSLNGGRCVSNTFATLAGAAGVPLTARVLGATGGNYNAVFVAQAVCKVKDLKARTEETVAVSDLVATLKAKGVVPVGCELAAEMMN